MQPTKKFSCADCNYMARSAACLKQHKRIKHDGIRYPCDECGYAATISSDLKKHKQSIHEGIKYPCDICDFAASTQSNLKHHKQSKHEGVRFYCDQECMLIVKIQNYSFSRRKHIFLLFLLHEKHVISVSMEPLLYQI